MERFVCGFALQVVTANIQQRNERDTEWREILPMERGKNACCIRARHGQSLKTVILQKKYKFNGRIYKLFLYIAKKKKNCFFKFFVILLYFYIFL